MNNQNMEQKTYSFSRDFKLVFRTVLGLSLLLLFICIFLSYQEPLNPTQTEIFNNCSTLMKMGFGAIFGMFGGSISNPRDS